MKIANFYHRPGTKKRLLWALAVSVIIGATFYLAVPPLLRSVLTKQLEERLHRKTSIHEAWINPFTLSVQIKGLSIKELDATTIFVSLESLYVNLDLMSLFKRALILHKVEFKEPYFRVARIHDSRYNFSDITDEFTKKPAAPAAPSGEPFRFSINNIRISGGNIDFLDEPKHRRHKVAEINIGIPFISNLPYNADILVKPEFRARFNNTLIDLNGKTKPFNDSHSTSLDIDIRNLDIPGYMEYLPVKIRFKVSSGAFDIKMSLSFEERQDNSQSLNIYGNIALKKLVMVDEKDKPLINIPLLNVPVKPSEVSLKKMNFGNILMDRPEINISRNKKGEINLIAALLPERERDAVEKKEEVSSAPFAVEADEIRISKGALTYSDQTTSTPFNMKVKDINTVVSKFSTIPSKKASLEISLVTDTGEDLKHKGEFSIDPVMAEGKLDIKGIALNRYAPYYEDKVRFDIRDGALDLSTGYKFIKDGDTATTRIMGLAGSLRSLVLRRTGEKKDFLRIPLFSVSDIDVDLTKHEVTLGEISSSNASLNIIKEKDGNINLSGLIRTGPEEKHKGKAETPKQQEKKWEVLLKNLMIERYSVKIDDNSNTEPAALMLGPINVKGENISTRHKSKGRLSFRAGVNKTGSISATGSVGINPVSADLAAVIKKIDIVPFQPYFTDKITIILTSGDISAKGRLKVENDVGKGFKTSYAGEAEIDVISTVDKETAESLLVWNTLAFRGIKAATSPLNVEIDEISLNDFYSRIIINPDGKLNFQGIMKKEPADGNSSSQAKVEEKAPEPEENESEKVIKINKVTMKGGNINFSDHFIKPNFTLNLTGMEGLVTGLSSVEGTQANLLMKGSVDEYAPVEIAGTINPLKRDLSLDIRASVEGLELSPASPYSEKYAGYEIEKGKLSLDLKYNVEGRKLKADNRLFLDQLTFGKRVESPSATSLPVTLAVALLKNRRGEIDINLPISGSLDDPEFRLGRIIIQVILNLLQKAALSPFTLLSSMFGGEELSYVEFDYGSSSLTEPATARLDNLIKALYDRPGLKLEMSGRVDQVKDREGLKQSFMEQKVKAQKVKALVKKGVSVASVDDVNVEGDEYPFFLAMAYRESVPKPAKGKGKEPSAAEMEKEILENIQVTDDDLLQLSMQRTQKVKEHILQSGKVEQERVFLVTSRSAPADKKEAQRESRVDFTLK